MERLETILAAMQEALEAGIQAMLRLSDDIGEMANPYAVSGVGVSGRTGPLPGVRGR